MPDLKSDALNELARTREAVNTKLAVVGLDGFVDRIMHPVAQRTGKGENFTPFPNIAAFGERIVEAAGKSANIEIFPKLEKLGGNGPIMAEALLSTGVAVRYLGALGQPKVHPVFQEFARRTEAVSLCEPGVTHALEFADGKLMLGQTASLEEITYARLVDAIGEGAFLDLLSRTDLLALVNWTMIPELTAIFEELLDKVLPNLAPRARQFFFDLADPAKRPRDDLRNALLVMARFQNFGNVTLGLNLAESQQVAAALGLPDPGATADQLKLQATRIRSALNVGCVVIHPTHGAACATRDGAWWADGPFCDKPVITTGAGDHFNAGFATAQLLGLTPQSCLLIAVCVSGYYVRNAKSPSLSEVASFLRSW